MIRTGKRFCVIYLIGVTELVCRLFITYGLEGEPPKLGSAFTSRRVTISYRSSFIVNPDSQSSQSA